MRSDEPTEAGPPAAEGRASRAGPILRAALSEYAVLLLAIAYFLAASPFIPDLATPRNLANLLVNVLPLLAVALGETLVLIAGGVDLSVTSIIAACSVASAWAMTTGAAGGPAVPAPETVPLAILLALALGVSIGLFNGFAVTALGMPPFLVTLSTMTFIGGATLWATGSRNVANLPEAFTRISYGSILGLPPSVPIVVGLALLIHLMLGHSLFGQWLYATGLNPAAARVSGVPVKRVTAAAYVISGLCAAVGSLIYTARLETGSPTMGREILLDVIGATVIGGTSLFGGRGKVTWTVFGVILFALIDNTLNLLGLEYYTVMSAKGAVILTAAGADRLRARLLAGS